MFSSKRIISIGILLLFVTLFNFPATSVAKATATKIKLVVNGKTILTNVPQILNQGQPMIPLRKVCDAIGAKVYWNSGSKIIQCVKENAKLELTLLNNTSTSLQAKSQAAPVLVLNGRAYVAPHLISETFGTQVKWDKTKNILFLNVGPIVFYGDSITEGFPLNKYFTKVNIVNKGVNADNTIKAAARLKEITQLKPSKLFIMLGTNDARGNFDTAITFDNYNTIINTIQNECPYTKIFIQSVLPFGQKELDSNPRASNDKIKDINIGLQDISTNQHLTFVDIGCLYKDSTGLLSRKYSADGVHLLIPNYSLWAKTINALVNK